jgi:hypothetical protein
VAPRQAAAQALAALRAAAIILAALSAGAAAAAPAPGARPAAASPPAPEAVVSVALPAGAATVGERLEAIMTLRVRAGAPGLAAEPRFPAWRDAWGEAEVREHGEPRRRAGPRIADGAASTPAVVAGGATGGNGSGSGSGTGTADAAVYSQRLVLVAFRTGRVELPPVAIAVPFRTGTVQAWTPDRLALTVRSVLPPGPPGLPGPLGARDLKRKPAAGLVPLPFGAAFLWTLAALGALAIAAVWLLWRQERRRRRAAATAPAAPPLAPLAEMLAALDRLAAAPSALALHTGLSQALRRFLGRSLGFPAPESTTSEIQRRLLANGWPAAQVRPTVELLRACDLVKFARQEAGAERGRERLAAARHLAEDFAARGAAAAERARHLGSEAAG